MISHRPFSKMLNILARSWTALGLDGTICSVAIMASKAKVKILASQFSTIPSSVLFCRAGFVVPAVIFRRVTMAAFTSLLLVSSAYATIWWDQGGASSPHAWGNRFNWTIDEAGGPDPTEPALVDQDVEFNYDGLKQSSQTINLSTADFSAETRFTNSIKFSSTGTTTIQQGPVGTNPKIGLRGDPAPIGQYGTNERIGLWIEPNAGSVNIHAPIYLRGQQQWRNGNGLTLFHQLNLDGYQLEITGAGFTVIHGAIIGGGASILKKTGQGTLALNGPNSHAGGTNIGGGIVNFFDPANLGTAPVRFVDNGNGTLSSHSNMTIYNSVDLQSQGSIATNGLNLAIGGSVTGTGKLVKTGGGELTLFGVNDNSGGIEVHGGTLHGTSASLKGDITYFTPGNLIFNESGGGYNGRISGPAHLQKHGAGTLILSNVNSYSGGTTVFAGALQGNSASLQGAISTAGNTAVIFDQTGVGVFNGSISGGARLDKHNSGTLILPNNNDYSGGTRVFGGTLQGTTNSIKGNVQVDANTVVKFDQNFEGTYSGVVSGGGSLVKSGSGTLILSGTNLHQSRTQIDAGLLFIGSDANLGGTSASLEFNGGTLQFAPYVTTSRTITLNSPGGTVDTYGFGVMLHGQITGAGKLTKTGGGDLWLTNGGNNYSGGTEVRGGRLFVSNDSLGDGGVTFDGGMLFTSLDASPGHDFFTNQNVTLLAGGGTIDTYGNTATISGAISGSGALHKTGYGTLVLTGPNTYTGATTVSLGILQGNATSLPTDITNNGAVFFDQSTNGTFANVISGAGSFHKYNVGTLTLTRANTFSGNTNAVGGTLRLGNSWALQNSIVDYSNYGGSLSFGTITTAKF
jgi:autotransporter-associated beta strand protein